MEANRRTRGQQASCIRMNHAGVLCANGPVLWCDRHFCVARIVGLFSTECFYLDLWWGLYVQWIKKLCFPDSCKNPYTGWERHCRIYVEIGRGPVALAWLLIKVPGSRVNLNWRNLDIVYNRYRSTTVFWGAPVSAITEHWHQPKFPDDGRVVDSSVEEGKTRRVKGACERLLEERASIISSSTTYTC